MIGLRAPCSIEIILEFDEDGQGSIVDIVNVRPETLSDHAIEEYLDGEGGLNQLDEDWKHSNEDKPWDY